MRPSYTLNSSEGKLIEAQEKNDLFPFNVNRFLTRLIIIRLITIFFSYWKYTSICTYPIHIMFHVLSLFTHIDRAKDRYRRFYANELIKMHKMSIFYTEKFLISICLVFFHSSLWNTSTKQGRCKNISHSILNNKWIYSKEFY